MKKFFLIACCVAASLSAFADNEFGAEPTVLTSGVATNVWLNIELSDYTVDELKAITLDVELPTADWVMGTTPAAFGEGCMWDFDFDEPASVSNFSGKITKKTDDGTYYHFVMNTSSSTSPFHATKGHFVQVKIKAPTGTAPGYYPIKVRKNGSFAKSSKGAENITWTEDLISYVKVGDPTDGTFAVDGVLTSLANEGFASETGLKTLDLTNVTAVNGTFTYVDGREVVAPTATVNADLQYVGNKSRYSSINLPFDATIVSGEVYYLDQPGMDCMFFEEAASVKKDHTYLANGAVTLKATNAELEGVSTQENMEGMFIYENKIWYGENLTVKPTRGLFDGVYDSNLRIVINGEPTGITAAQIDAQSDNTYDLKGRQVQNAKNGVFVVNGKKQFVK